MMKLNRLFLVLLLALCVGGCVPSCSTVYKDSAVKVVEHKFLIVHAGWQEFEIRAAGKSYRNVYGAGQAFLRTSDTNVIVFVVGGNIKYREFQPLDLHVLNLKTKQDSVIRLGSVTDYNLWIDAAQSDVKVESYDGNRLVLFSTREKIDREGPERRFVPIGRLEIDLDKKQIVSSTGSK